MVVNVKNLLFCIRDNRNRCENWFVQEIMDDRLISGASPLKESVSKHDLVYDCYKYGNILCVGGVHKLTPP